MTLLSAILLHQCRHRFVTLATRELSNVLLSLLSECRLNDVSLPSTYATVAMMIDL